MPKGGETGEHRRVLSIFSFQSISAHGEESRAIWIVTKMLFTELFKIEQVSKKFYQRHSSAFRGCFMFRVMFWHRDRMWDPRIFIQGVLQFQLQDSISSCSRNIQGHQIHSLSTNPSTPIDLTPIGHHEKLAVMSCIIVIFIKSFYCRLLHVIFICGSQRGGVCEVKFLSNLNPSLLEWSLTTLRLWYLLKNKGFISSISPWIPFASEL